MKINEPESRFLNNFDIIRALAALLVIYSHTYAATGSAVDYKGSSLDPLKEVSGTYTLGTLGVYIFFITSGYLIPKSALRSQSISNYFKKRILRILPALIFVSAVMALIIGPIYSELTIYEYFSNYETYLYLTTFNLYFMPYTLPGVFVDNPTPNIVNGPLWTLSAEFTCYIIVAIFAYLKILKRFNNILIIHLTVLSFFIFVDINATPISSVPTSYYLLFPIRFLGGNSTIIFYLYFSSGMLLSMLGNKIKYNYKIFILLMSIYIYSIFSENANLPYLNNPKAENFPILSLLTLPYIIIYLSKVRIKMTNNFGRMGDPSYGMYILHWPILQLLVTEYNFSRIENAFLCCLFITIPLAYFSWHFIEKKAMLLKKSI